jgi:chitin disaccharide deacetylase
MKRLIVNADDFGWSEAVTGGILCAHAEGVLTSTTVMANLASAGPALEQARRQAPRLAVGIHLNLTEGEPLTPRDQAAPLLGADGCMRPSPADLFRTVRGSAAALAAAEKELEAQIVRARALGLEPSHLDSHKHVHLYPRLLAVVIGLARRHGIRAVRTTPEIGLPGLSGRLPREWKLKDRLRQRVNTWVLRRWGRRAQREVRRAGLVTADWFFGVRVTGGVSAEVVLHLLRHAPDGTGELMVHPGLADASPGRPSRLNASRPRELAALCDPRVRRLAEETGWTWASYKDLHS